MGNERPINRQKRAVRLVQTGLQKVHAINFIERGSREFFTASRWHRLFTVKFAQPVVQKQKLREPKFRIGGMNEKVFIVAAEKPVERGDGHDFFRGEYFFRRIGVQTRENGEGRLHTVVG